MNFRTEIQPRDVDIRQVHHLLPELGELSRMDDYDIEPCPFFVSWNLELEARDWGVKDMSWYLTGIEGQFEVVYYDENGDEKDRKLVDFNFAPFERAAELDIDIDGRQIAFDQLDIDYSDNGVRVY